MGFLSRGNKEEDTSGGSKDHRTASNKKKKNILQKAAEKSLTLKAIKVVGKGLENFAKPFNVKRRKQFISKYNTRVPPGERINITDDELSSNKSLASLKDVGYKTISDTTVSDNKDDNRNTSILAGKPSTQLQKAAVKKAPEGPTTVDMAKIEETEAERLLKIKRKGRRATKLLADEDKLTLSTKTLLG